MARSQQKSGNHTVGSIVGTAIKLSFVVAMAGLVFYYFNNGNDIKKAIREQSAIIDNLNATLASQQLLHDAGRKNQITALEIDSYGRQMQLLEERKTNTKTQIELVNKKIVDAKEKWNQYRESYRKVVRASMIGTKYDEFTTQSGRKFQNVIIKQIDDKRISLQHEVGSVSIPWKELPPAMIDRLQFTDELAAVRTKAEQDAAEQVGEAASKSFLLEVIAGIDEQIKVAEEKFRVKSEDYNGSRAKTLRAFEDIGYLQTLIIAQEKKGGSRRIQPYVIQIEQHRSIIETENNRIVDYPAETAKHRALVNTLIKRRQVYRDKLAKMEK